MRLVAALAVLLSALACMGGPSAPASTLVRLEAGDIACYVVLAGPDGTETTYDGDFDLCPGAPGDATGLIGRAVVPEMTRQEVMAGSCEGDPECTDHETVDFVKSLKAAD